MKIILLTMLFLAGVIILSITSRLEAQDTKKVIKTEDRKNPVSKIINRMGSKIPIIENLSEPKTDEIEIDGVLTTTNCYRFKKDIRVEIEGYSVANDNTLFIGTYKVQVRKMCSYQVTEKIFAYEIDYIPYSVTDQGIINYQGTLFTSYYSDEDGDTIFETQYQGSEVPNILPEWVKSKQISKK